MQASILVIDDNPLILSVVKGLLENSGHHVITSENGVEALDNLKLREVDLIICDVMMPKMGGFELQSKIQEDPKLNSIPFLFLSSINEPEKISQAKADGADDYLVKPFEPAELLALVRGRLKKYANTKQRLDHEQQKFKKNLINVISHELRTPLVAIKAGAEMLLHSDIYEEELKNEIIHAILRGGERLESFVEDFIVLQKIEAGARPELSLEKCSPVALMKLFLEKKKEALEKAGFVIKEDFQADVPVFGDQAKIFDIIKRLVANSIKFSHQNKEITFSSRIINNKFEISIGDKGIGIGDFSINPIEAFVQLDREKLEQQGVGIGLTIAATYAKLFGAELLLANREKGGTVATVLFSLAEEF